MDKQVRIHIVSYDKLVKISEKLVGNPAIVNLIDEAVDLLAKKHLGEKNHA